MQLTLSLLHLVTAWYSGFPGNKQVFILLNFLILKIVIIIIHLYTVYLQLQTWKKQVSRAYNVAAICCYEGWNFNSGNYLFTTDTK